MDQSPLSQTDGACPARILGHPTRKGCTAGAVLRATKGARQSIRLITSVPFASKSASTCNSNGHWAATRSEEHTSELQSLMRISYAVFCLKKKKTNRHQQKNE